MTEPAPLLWVPSAVAEQLATALRASLSPWAQAWGLPAPDQVICQALSHVQAAECTADQSEQFAVDAAATVHLMGTRALRSGLAQAFFKTGLAQSPLAEQVVTKALQALKSALVSRVVLRGATQSPAHHAGLNTPGHWGLRGSAKVGECLVQVLLPMNVLQANGWLPRAALAGLARWKPETVFGALPVHFVARLGRANVDVGELASLDVGDIILVSQTSNNPMQLLAVDADLELHAYLGAQGNQRAAQLMASTRGTAR